MYMATHLDGFSVAIKPVDISYTAAAVDGTDLTTYTFSSQAIGAAASDRIVVAAIGGRGTADGRVISSVTIGGITATQIVKNSASGGGVTSTAGIYAALVPTGTTATVVVTFSGGMVRAALDVYRMVGASGLTAFASGSVISGNPQAVSLDTPAFGAAVGVGLASASASAAWSGLVEDSDRTVEAGSSLATAAHSNFNSTQTGLSCGITWATGAQDVMCAASWAP